MGQDVFMQRLDPSGKAPYDRDLVIEILTCGALDPSSRYFISYPDGGRVLLPMIYRTCNC